MRPNSESDFWKHVVKQADGCWIWTGHRLGNGYGQFSLRMRKLAVHRYSYELAKGKIPTGLTIDHLCRVRSCVNPAHLEAVPSRENVLRGIGLTAANARKDVCKHGHPLDGIRTAGGRYCKTCARLNSSPEGSTPVVVTARAWAGGPLRQYKAASRALSREGRPDRYDPTKSAYVCDRCLEPVGGVYEPRSGKGWLCGTCRGQN